jgi:hypothetical protein
MQRQQEEIQEVLCEMWQDQFDTCYDVDINSYINGIEDCTPPPDDSDDKTNEQTEYEMLYNATGSVEAILTILIEFADSGRKLGSAALLALRDKAEFFGSDIIATAIDDYMAKNDNDEEFGYDIDR